MIPLLFLFQNSMHVYNEVWPFQFLPDLPTLISQPHYSSALGWTVSWSSLVTSRWACPSAKMKIRENKAVPSCSSTCWNFVFSNIWRRSSREWIRMIRGIFVQYSHRWSYLNTFRVRINTEAFSITWYETLVRLQDQMSNSVGRVLPESVCELEGDEQRRCALAAVFWKNTSTSGKINISLSSREHKFKGRPISHIVYAWQRL